MLFMSGDLTGLCLYISLSHSLSLFFLHQKLWDLLDYGEKVNKSDTKHVIAIYFWTWQTKSIWHIYNNWKYLYFSYLLFLACLLSKEWSLPREGVIIECPLIYLFHKACDVILTSRNDVRGIPSDDNDNEMSILTLKRR